MKIQTYLQKHRSGIEKETKEYLLLQKKQLDKINQWSRQVIDKYLQLTPKGKLIRGNLLLLSLEGHGGEITKTAYQAAAALEIFQTAVLVHDDIIDRDEKRRGIKTFHQQYRELAENQNQSQTEWLGYSQAICAGDIGFFLGFKLFSCLEINPEQKNKLCKLCSQELLYLGLGEMEDISFEHTKKEVSIRKILKMYKYKTARYSFVWPLLIGTVLSGDTSQQKKLEELGVNLGLVFQLRDDKFGLQEETKNVGKPGHSDIKKGKKTLYRYYLFKHSTRREQRKLKKIFGNHRATKQEINYVLKKIKQHKIEAKISQQMKKYKHKATTGIKDLQLKKEQKQLLQKLLDYIAVRDK